LAAIGVLIRVNASMAIPLLVPHRAILIIGAGIGG